MARHHDSQARHSTFQGLLKIFNISTSPTVAAPADDEAIADVDEPPDSTITQTTSTIPETSAERQFPKSPRTPLDRRESLLTKALIGPTEVPGYDKNRPSRPTLSGTSSNSMHSGTSATSMAELSSDGFTSPARTATPSPPLPSQYKDVPVSPQFKINNDPKIPLPVTADTQEAALEANLGRKRCISFVCGRRPSAKPELPPAPNPAPKLSTPPKRKPMVTFNCPSRVPAIKNTETTRQAFPQAPLASAVVRISPKQALSVRRVTSRKDASSEETVKIPSATKPSEKVGEPEHFEALRFHEFASSNEEDEPWMHEKIENKQRITMSDCMKKEEAIRRIGKEAEEEAEEDERAAEELDDEYDDEDQEDDFAPSDEGSDDGNESDNEEGFAESDDESIAGSDDLFWAPSTTTAATSTEFLDNVKPTFTRRESISSTGSFETGQPTLPHPPTTKVRQKRQSARTTKMRPGTPDLPDSTDFVCGTLDEDRPLEAAYISCMEQRKRAKYIPVPQDIDPSFPTTDPEDQEDDEEELGEDRVDSDAEPQWLKGQFDEVGGEQYHGHRRKSSLAIKSPAPSPKRMHSPAPKHRGRLMSPPPQHTLFGHASRRLRSPAPGIRITSPPGTRRTSLASTPQSHTPVGLTITTLAHRPNMTRTASLPHTPNPFFRSLQTNSHDDAEDVDTVTPTAGAEGDSRERHVRGAIDIVIGLEKKRQKRKEKFWRQHGRKYAKEQAERRPIPGKGAERMKELGLECAERNRAYGIGQQTQLVISL